MRGMGETCTYEGCDRPVQARNLCVGHYQQSRRGKPLAPLQPYRKRYFQDLRIIRRFVGVCHAHELPPQAKPPLGGIYKTDWLASRSETAAEGTRVAQTLAVDDAVYAFWYEGYTAYATSDELAVVDDLVRAAIKGEYPHIETVRFEDMTVSEMAR